MKKQWRVHSMEYYKKWPRAVSINMDTLKNSAGKIKQGMEHTTMYYLQKVLKHAKPEHIVYVYKHL